MDQEMVGFLSGYGKQKRSTLPPGELLELPIKPQIVIEFEASKPQDKAKVRDSPEWPEIARYYDRYHEVIQHNVAEHAWRQQIGHEPVGKVAYANGNFVKVTRDHIPKDRQWEFGPDNFWHDPNCTYRLSGYQTPKCECHPGRKPPRISKDDPEEEVPF